METRILNTEEVFRVTYNDGDFEVLIKQTYKDGTAPFYCIKKGLHGLTPVETYSESLDEIQQHLEKCLKMDKKALGRPSNSENPKIRTIYEYCLSKQQEFIDKLKEFKKTELVSL